MMKILFAIFFSVALLFGCKEEVDQTAKDEGIIKKYLDDNNLTATRHSSGLYYIIKKSGFGGYPSYNATVKVTYKGYLTDGTVFDKTASGSSISFPLYNLIEGWQIGIPLLQRGGSGTFYIPSALGYGSRAQTGIPANSVLIFDISLIDF